jgi:hypothetical protein
MRRRTNISGGSKLEDTILLNQPIVLFFKGRLPSSHGKDYGSLGPQINVSSSFGLQSAIGAGQLTSSSEGGCHILSIAPYVIRKGSPFNTY